MADRSAQTVWEGDLTSGSGRTSFFSGSLPEVGMTWASRTQSPDGKTSPEELIAAGHAACYAMGFANLLAKEGHAPERVTVRATVTFEVGQAGPRITRSALEVAARVSGLDEAGLQEAAARSDKGCPVSNALRGNVEITVQARLEA